MSDMDEIRRHVETIATDRDFVVHANHVTEEAIDALRRLTAPPAQASEGAGLAAVSRVAPAVLSGVLFAVCLRVEVGGKA